MVDFIQIRVKERTEKQGGGLIAYPDWVVGRSEDLMVRAKSFYAVWDEQKGLWSTDEYDVQRIVDDKLNSYRKENKDVVEVKLMKSFSSNGQSTFRKFMREIGDNAHQLDETLTFQGTKVGKKDYVSKRLPYDLAEGDHSAWDELVGTLYKPDERAKIEWAIGAIVAGASKKIQKFLVLYGPPGAGKGTILNIILMLFDGYVTTFDAAALASNGNQFAAAAFSGNPLVAIQHDGDLSRVENNTTLNSIVSHEIMRMNEKFKPSYDARVNAFLLMGTNKPVKITDAQSGLIRRLIDVHPSGVKLPPGRYHALMDRITFELGAIAHHCLQVFKEMGENYYSNYQPLEMMFKTNAFFNFIEANYNIFAEQNGTSVEQAWMLFKTYCEKANVDTKMTRYAFKSELGNYFDEFHIRHTMDDGTIVRSWYSGFKAEPFKTPVDDDLSTFTLRLDETISLLDLELAEHPAQYASARGAPKQKWEDVTTRLAEIDTSREHFVGGLAPNHIVADFDLKDDNGKKSLERNLREAAKWPATYAELSRSGDGVHLHFYYDGDPERLDSLYAPGIEIKRFPGHSSLRRRLTRCNNVPIATINSGLPLKENTRVIEPGTMKSEKALRDLIARNLRKEIHPGTKPSVDFIKKILDDAYNDGLRYDVTDLRPKITTFASRSSNRALECLKIVNSMRWKSEEDELPPDEPTPLEPRLVFYDIECYPNLFVICWKFEEDEPSVDSVVTMINPKPHEVEALFKYKLVGFNNRSYDNHMMWAAAMGFSIPQLYALSQKIINNSVGAKFGEAYNLSYTDIFDYSTKKQGLKKWQIELGLEHREMDIPWDKPVPEDRIMDVAAYCANDVVSTEKTHKHLQGDWKARLILSDLSGLTPNHTTANHTARIIFGRDKNPQRSFVYTDLSKDFPGYVYGPKDGVKGNPMVSTYRGVDVGEGGYVYAEPGIYRDVALLDVASMHPTSIGQLNLFGEYTPRYMALVEAQLALKHGNYDSVKGAFDGKLRPYVEDIERLRERDPEAAKKATKDLRDGLKIAMNIVYGLTSAKFDNPFRDLRNVDNIVAKRGALFMVDLKNYIQDQGFTVAHIKTDSVKIPNATPEIIEAVVNFAAKYGYSMEYDPEKDQYSKLALVNDAVYVAKKDNCVDNCWTATGSQFHPDVNPYVFKKLFGYDDDINFFDLCVTKHVQQGALYLDFGNHDYTRETGDRDPSMGYVDDALYQIKAMKKGGSSEEDQAKVYSEALDKLIFIGKTGRFTPVLEGYGGGQLWRVKDGKAYAVQGTKGHLWVDSKIAMDLPGDAIDYGFFDHLVEEARANIDQFLVGSGFSSVAEFLS